MNPLGTQRSIIAENDAEQEMIFAKRELISRFQQKIQTSLACIWEMMQSIGHLKRHG